MTWLQLSILNWQALDHVHPDYSSVKGILLCLKTI